MQSFEAKWKGVIQAQGRVGADERSLFVESGQEPITQRQLNLYYYYLFIKQILSESGARQVLEAGAGRGTISLYLSSYLGLGLTLIDNVSEAMELAESEFKKRGLEAKLVVGNILHAPFPENAFDAVVSIGLAEHFVSEDVFRLFAEQYRILRPGGVVISLNIPKKFSVQTLNTAMRFVKKVFGGYREEVKKDYFRNALTAHQYEKIARQAGFVRTRVIHVCPFPIYVPISMNTDKIVTWLRKNFSLRLRSLFQAYPYATNPVAAQAHFLVGYKPATKHR